MRNKRVSKNKTILLLIVVVLVAAALSTAISYYYTSKGALEIQKIPMDIKVQQKFGFNLDTDKLHFGGVFPGGSSERGVIIVNNRDFPLKARFYMSGEIGSWVKPEDNPIYLQPSENRTVKFTAKAPENAEFGNYTGEVTVVFKKA